MAASRRRDLRSGEPVWLGGRRPGIPSAQLDGNAQADVVVVGGGVSGALVADALLQAGLTVIAVDRRGFVRGSTPASTALLQFEIDQPLTLLSKALGEERAARAWWRSATAVDYLRDRVADLRIACAFRPRETVYLPGNILDPAALANEATARLRIGLRSRFAERDEVRAMTGLDAPCAIVSAGCAEVDPVKLVSGLWRSVARRGGRLFAPVEIVEVDHSRDGVELGTEAGLRLSARFAAFATGYELMPFVPGEGHRIMSTWAMATRPQKERLWPSRALIWEAADPYLYMRTTADGRVIAGGEDEKLTDGDRRDALTPRKIEAIGKKLARYMPELSVEPEFAWSGFFGESETGLPTIGPIPRMKRCFAVLGYGGNGVTFSAIAAQLVQRAVVGLKDPDADLFAFGG